MFARGFECLNNINTSSIFCYIYIFSENLVSQQQYKRNLAVDMWCEKYDLQNKTIRWFRAPFNKQTWLKNSQIITKSFPPNSFTYAVCIINKKKCNEYNICNQHNSWPMSRMYKSAILLINFVLSLSLFSMRNFFWEYLNSRLLMKKCSERWEIQSHGNNAQKDETNRRKGRPKCETILYDLMFDCIVDDCQNVYRQ